MNIKKIVINHFGKLSNLTIPVDSKVTVVTGENESGKSTLHNFIGAILFGMERARGRAAKTDNFTHFTPWNGGTYGGVIEFEERGKLFSLTREFSKEKQGMILTNETDCRNVDPQHLPQLLHGLNYSIYQNTISVNQLSASTGDALSDELRNHIINLRSAGSFNLDVAGALSELKACKKRVESGYSAKSQLEAEELSLRITSMKEDIESGPELPDLPRLLAERELKETHIRDAESQSALLMQSISGSEESLRTRHIASSEEVALLEEDVISSSDNIVNYARKHRINSKSGARAIYILLLILACLGFAAAAFMAVISYLNGALDTMLLIYAGAALACLIVITIVSANLSSVNKYHGMCEGFLDLYEKHVGDRATKIGDDEISALLAAVHGYQLLFENIRSGHKKLADNKQSADNARGELAILNTDIDRAREAKWQFEQKEEALAALNSQLSSLDADLDKNDAIRNEADAISLAANTMQRLSKEAFDSFGHFLEATTSQLLSDITDGAYSGVSISEDFDITLLQDGRRVPLYAVSSGTLDQVYLALRLACIEFLWPDEAMPLLLDDTFTLYDKSRLARTLSWLCENYGGQIIIFSCQSREADLLDELGVRYEKIVM